MKNNNIEILKNKYFFIGFIIGIIPFLILIAILTNYPYTEKYKTMIVILSIITSLINGYILRYNVSLKVKES